MYATTPPTRANSQRGSITTRVPPCGPKSVSRATPQMTPAVISDATTARTRSVAVPARASTYTAKTAGASAPPMLTVTPAGSVASGMSMKLPTNTTPSAMSACVSFRCMRSRTRWAAPNKMMIANARRTSRPSGTGLSPFPASVPAPAGRYAAAPPARKSGHRVTCRDGRWLLQGYPARSPDPRVASLSALLAVAQSLGELVKALHHVADGDPAGAGIAVRQRRFLFLGLRLGLRRLRIDRLDAQPDAARLRVEVDDLHFHVLARLHNVGDVFHPVIGELRDMDQTLDAVLQLHEGAEVDRARDFALHDLAFTVAIRDGQPRIGLGSLEAKRDALALGIDRQHLNLDFLTLAQHVPRVLDPAVGQLRHVQQAFHAAADIDERAEIRDPANDARDDLAGL